MHTPGTRSKANLGQTACLILLLMTGRGLLRSFAAPSAAVSRIQRGCDSRCRRFGHSPGDGADCEVDHERQWPVCRATPRSGMYAWSGDAGFKKFIRAGIELRVNDRLQVDVVWKSPDDTNRHRDGRRSAS